MCQPGDVSRDTITAPTFRSGMSQAPTVTPGVTLRTSATVSSGLPSCRGTEISQYDRSDGMAGALERGCCSIL